MADRGPVPVPIPRRRVPDIAAPDAFVAAIKGVSAAAHVVTISSLDPDPHNVIPQTVAGALSVLRAASQEPAVRRVVYTSSAAAAIMPILGAEGPVGRDSWNDVAVQMAWAPPPYDTTRAMVTYMASKVEAEKAVWRFVEEEKPGFVVNVISPATTLGQALHPTHLRGSPGWLHQLWEGDTSQIAGLAASKCLVLAKEPCPRPQLRMKILTGGSQRSTSMSKTLRCSTSR